MTRPNHAWSTPSLPPNLRWLAKHSGETVQITFDHAQYIVTVERKENSTIGVDSPSPEMDVDADANEDAETNEDSEDETEHMFEIGDGGDAP